MSSIATYADLALRVIGDAQQRIEQALDPSVRLGVTGLSRSGKTVFITSLVANLLNRGRMPLLDAAAEGRIEAAVLQPQPDHDVPRFEYEAHLAKLLAPEPEWPESTKQISQLRLSIRYRPLGALAGMSQALTGPSILNLDIIDYPGEWLLDLPLMGMRYADWAAASIEVARRPERVEFASAWLTHLESMNASAPADELDVQRAAHLFADYLRTAKEGGFSSVAPGRFLLPGDLAGAPAVTFAPVILRGHARAGTMARLMEERFEAYKRVVIRPFFRDHFARLDRQIVLLDALSAIDKGPEAVADMQEALSGILTCFRPGRNSWLSLWMRKKVDRIVFAATKADHIHHLEHEKLNRFVTAMLRERINQAEYRGARVFSLPIASLRSTVEEEKTSADKTLNCIRGRLLSDGRDAALYPGTLPENPGQILTALTSGQNKGWLAEEFQFMRFAPPLLKLGEGEGPPHIRLDKALNFLIGDKLG